MSVFEAIVLGILQGVTEFLPVSSTGHLILAREALGLPAYGLAVDALLHFATALAVLVYFRKDVAALLKGLTDWLRGRFVEQKTKVLLTALIVATIPAVILGLLLESAMETAFRSAALVAGTLILGSVIMAGAEWFAKKRRGRKEDEQTEGTLTAKSALGVGLMQSLALIPGMSRSGMAISGGLFAGLSRYEAGRFAFLLALPLLLGSGAKKIMELGESGALISDMLALSLGALSAFAVGLAAIHWMLRFIQNRSLMVFVYYRLALAALIFVLL